MAPSRVRTFLIIYGAYVWATIIYFVVGFVLQQPDEPTRGPFTFIIPALYGLAIAAILVGWAIGVSKTRPIGWVRDDVGNLVPDRTPGAPEPESSARHIARVQAAVIMAAAFMEASAVFGLVAIVLNWGILHGYVLIAMSLFALLAFLPRVLMIAADQRAIAAAE